MNTRVWRRAVRLPQTYILMGGVVVGYSVVLGFAGTRGLVVASGGAISLAMVASWIRQVKQLSPSANLLDPAVFQEQIWQYRSLIPVSAKSVWDRAIEQAQTSQEAATQIGDHVPDVISELLQLLYSVLALLEMIAHSARALEQLETSTYRQTTEDRLQRGLQRLNSTQEQLRAIQDQVLLSHLDPALAGQLVSLPLQLQDLVEANKAVLQMHSSSPLKR